MIRCFVLLVLFICTVYCDNFVLRIRRSDGQMKRLILSHQSTFSDLQHALRKTGFVSASGAEQIRFRDSCVSCVVLINNHTKLLDTQIQNGDVLDIEPIAPSPASKPSTRNRLATNVLQKEAIKASNRKKIRTLADIEKERSALVKISRQVPNSNLSVSIPNGVAGWLREWKLRNSSGVSKSSCVLLLGNCTNDDSRGAVHVEVHTAFDIPASEATSGELDESSVFILNKATLVANAMGLTVLGCCFDVRSSKVGTLAASETGSDSTLSPASVRTSLRIRSVSLLRDSSALSQFIVITCKDRDQGREIELEAFHLSDQAIALHKDGLLSTAMPADGVPEHSSLVTLRGPVLLPNAVESVHVDSHLLLVPVCIRNSSREVIGFSHNFPSLVQIENSEFVQHKAREYLCTTLRRVVQEPLGSRRRSEALRRLWDANLLLYLSLLMEEAVFGELCRHLSLLRAAVPQNRGDAPLPAEVNLSLETLLLSLET